MELPLRSSSSIPGFCRLFPGWELTQNREEKWQEMAPMAVTTFAQSLSLLALGASPAQTSPTFPGSPAYRFAALHPQMLLDVVIPHPTVN